MFKHKILELLSSLTSEEYKRLGEFINSPYFNKSKNVIRAYEYFSHLYPEFNQASLTKEDLYKKIFKQDNYNDSSLRNVFSKFVNLIQLFLVIDNYRNEKLNRNNVLLEELLWRNMDELFVKNLKNAENMMRNVKEVDFDYLLNRYKLERNKFNFSILNDRIVNKRKIFPQIKKLGDAGIYLSIYFITEIISDDINLIVYAEKFNTEGKVQSIISKILECIDCIKIYQIIHNQNDCDFILEIYIALLVAFTNLDDYTKYDEYKRLVQKYKYKLSRDEISFHFSIMVGRCILGSKLEDQKNIYYGELLELYDEILINKYYKNKKRQYLPESIYRDILILKVRLNRLDQVKSLIDDFCGKIQPSERGNMFNFSNAFYYFKNKEYSKSLNSINKIRLDYFIYKYDIKNLLLRVYYELGYYEESISLIHSYRELIRKDDFLTELRKTRYKNFIRYLRKLIILKIDNKIKEIELLRLNLKASESTISHRNWLLEKMADSVNTAAQI